MKITIRYIIINIDNVIFSIKFDISSPVEIDYNENIYFWDIQSV